MKTLLLGKDGQVGWELQRALAPLGPVVALGSGELDITHLELLRQTIRDTAPDVIVNAAAYTAVDKAQSEPERAMRVNAEAVNVLAQEASRAESWLVHYSTDYIFDGTKAGPYTEHDSVRPLSVYGLSKLAGEEAIRNHHKRHLIF